MDLFRYFIRFLYKIRWYLIILPIISLIVAWFLTRNMEHIYDTNTTIYTGMITGYNLEGTTGSVGGNSQTNITNLMLIVTTDNTIHEVALKLFGRGAFGHFPGLGISGLGNLACRAEWAPGSGCGHDLGGAAVLAAHCRLFRAVSGRTEFCFFAIP